jgi:hypothetical protein
VLNFDRTHKFLLSVVIDVDLKRPEMNREFVVFKLKDIKGVDGKSHFEGFFIQYMIDSRWIFDNDKVDPYTARVFTSSSVLFKVPAWSFSVLSSREGFGEYCESNVTDAMDDARHDYVAKTEQKHENTMPEAKKWRYYLLQFPGDVQLATKCINANAGDDEVLELDIIPIEYQRPDDAKATNEENWAGWTVARTDTKAHKRGKIDVKKHVSEAAAKFAKRKTKGTKMETT